LLFESSELDGLTGSYFDDFNAGELIITRADGDVLSVSAPDLDAAGVSYEPAMTALSTRVWLLTAQGQQLDFSFIDGPDGETYFRNRSVVAVRPAPAMRAERTVVHPSREAIRQALQEAAREPMPALMLPPALRR
jgi:hypothetical protein